MDKVIHKRVRTRRFVTDNEPPFKSMCGADSKDFMYSWRHVTCTECLKQYNPAPKTLERNKSLPKQTPVVDLNKFLKWNKGG